MFRLIAIVLMALAAAAHAEPKPAVIAPLAYNAPLIAAAPNAAIYSREYHGNFAAPYLAAAAAAAPYVASPYVAAAAPAPYVAAAAPYVGSPYVAAAAPAPYVAAAPFAAAAYSAPILLKK